MAKALAPLKPTRPMVASFPEPADKEKAQALADLALRPSVNAAVVAAEHLTGVFGEQDMGSLAATLTASTENVVAGDLSQCEAMLYGQANALQAIFVSLARRAAMQEGLKQWEAHYRIALKAQNQCRMTLETLATIKNPPVVFARQANFAAGHQQVNNGMAAPPQPSRAANIEIEPNKLLEAQHGERLDTRTPGAASGANQELATVGAIDGATIGRR